MHEKLLTKEQIRRFPFIGETEGHDNPLVIARWFSCANGWTWLATEACALLHDGSKVRLADVTNWYAVADVLFFGVVFGFETEYGYWSFNEFQAVNRTRAVGVERDKYFTSVGLKDAMAQEERQRGTL